MPIDEAGLVPAKAAYMLFYGDHESDEVQGTGGSINAKEFDYRGDQFIVNAQTGTLRYRNEPKRQVLGSDAYVLAIVNVAERPCPKEVGASGCQHRSVRAVLRCSKR